MWKPEHRRAGERRGLRYPSDLTDAEWTLIERLIPPAKRGGRHREVNVREIVKGQPDSRNHRQPECQSGSKGGSALDPQGFDAGKKVTGRKRQILIDTLGLLLNVVVHSANAQDRDGVRWVLDRRTLRLFPFIERVFADAGYQGPKAAATIARSGTWKLEIVKRNELHRFVALPKRWIVERTLAWISHNRRLTRDFERYAKSAAAFIRLAMIRIMLRRLTRPTYSS